MNPEIIHITDIETLKNYKDIFMNSIVKNNNNKKKYPIFIDELEPNIIILLYDQKMIGYLKYEYSNYISYKGNVKKTFIYIDYIEIHPLYKGKKYCNLLITSLIDFYKDDPNINEYQLDNQGGLLAYKCYTSSFRLKGFLPKYKYKMTLENSNIKFYNTEVEKNVKNIRSGNKKLNNINKTRKYNGMMIFIKKN